MTSVAWSPDSAQIVSGSRDKTVVVWGASTGNRVSTLTGHTGGILSVAWKGDQIASGSADKTAVLWGTGSEAGKQLSLQGHTDWVRGVAFSNQDGAQLATCSDDKSAIIWNSSSGSQLAKLEGHNGFVNSVAWSADNTLVGTASSDKTAMLWDSGSGQVVSRLQGHSGAVVGVAWGAESRQVATCSEDGSVMTWDAAGGGRMAAMSGRTVVADVTHVVGSPAEDLASGAVETTLGIRDVAGEAWNTQGRVQAGGGDACKCCSLC